MIRIILNSLKNPESGRAIFHLKVSGSRGPLWGHHPGLLPGCRGQHPQHLHRQPRQVLKALRDQWQLWVLESKMGRYPVLPAHQWLPTCDYFFCGILRRMTFQDCKSFAGAIFWVDCTEGPESCHAYIEDNCLYTGDRVGKRTRSLFSFWSIPCSHQLLISYWPKQISWKNECRDKNKIVFSDGMLSYIFCKARKLLFLQR